jgi:hypothetical protein
LFQLVPSHLIMTPSNPTAYASLELIAYTESNVTEVGLAILLQLLFSACTFIVSEAMQRITTRMNGRGFRKHLFFACLLQTAQVINDDKMDKTALASARFSFVMLK